MTESTLEEWKKASLQAVKSVEALSSVELVIALRKNSRAFVLADVILGAAVAVGTTLFLLYSATNFALHFFAWLPLLTGAAVGFLASRTSWLRRRLTSTRQRQAHLQEAAQSAFFDLHVGNTRDRTGVLLFFCRLEGTFFLVCDQGVDRVSLENTEAWEEQMMALEETWRKKAKPSEWCQYIEKLGPLFAVVVPKRQDDINELSDEVAL
ncbi:MAG: hypothetical protein JKY56_08930 [Kofleriaceae bacterium]|nr:hypothetical protein [Kofleriaceae bacterium]